MINLKTMIPKMRNQFGYDQLRSFQIGGQIEEQTNEQDPTELIYILYKFVAAGKPPKGGKPDDIITLLQNNETETAEYAAEYKTKTPQDLQQDKDFMAFHAQFQPEQNQAIFAAKGAKLQKLNILKKSKKIETVTDAISNPVLTKKSGGDVSYPGNALSGPTIYGKKKPAVITKQIVQTTRVPNTYKGMDVGVTPANSHEESKKVIKKVTVKAEGGRVKLVKKGAKKKCTCGCEMIKSKATGGKVIETCSCKCGGKMKKKK